MADKPIDETFDASGYLEHGKALRIKTTQQTVQQRRFAPPSSQPLNFDVERGANRQMRASPLIGQSCRIVRFAVVMANASSWPIREVWDGSAGLKPGLLKALQR
jgi:hypothetical protein